MFGHSSPNLNRDLVRSLIAEIFELIILKDDYYLHSIDLPGVTQENISVEVIKNTLQIQGERQKSWGDSTSRRYGHFSHSLRLPKDSLEESLKAHFENGVLFIAVAKKEEPKAKKVEITKGGKDDLWQQLLKNEETKAS